MRNWIGAFQMDDTKTLECLDRVLSRMGPAKELFVTDHENGQRSVRIVHEGGGESQAYIDTFGVIPPMILTNTHTMRTTKWTNVS